QNLSGNLTSGKVPLHPKLRRKTKLTIHGATHLAGHAYRRSMPVVSVQNLRILKCIGSVASLAAVTFGHPDGLDRFAVPERDQVADGSVSRDKALLNLGPADLDIAFSQAGA